MEETKPHLENVLSVWEKHRRESGSLVRISFVFHPRLPSTRNNVVPA